MDRTNHLLHTVKDRRDKMSWWMWFIGGVFIGSFLGSFVGVVLCSFLRASRQNDGGWLP